MIKSPISIPSEQTPGISFDRPVKPSTRNRSGQTFGLWHVLGFGYKKDGEVMWLCQCQCINHTLGFRDGYRLTSGTSSNCGCERSKQLTKRNMKHGWAGTPTHAAWIDMIRRCYTPKVRMYPRYGGRDITVCDRWRVQIDKHPFLYFLEDMGARPNKKYSLDRIDNDGNYTPENCRWATITQQGNNKSDNHLVEFQGESLTVTEWANKLGIRRGTLFHRLHHGWTPDQALTQIESKRGLPPTGKRTDRLLTFNNKTQNLTDWARELQMKPITLHGRIRSGWSVEKALTTPVNYKLSRHTS